MEDPIFLSSSGLALEIYPLIAEHLDPPSVIHFSLVWFPISLVHVSLDANVPPI